MYGLAERLGFKSAEKAWEANPVIQGSTEVLKILRLLSLLTILRKGRGGCPLGQIVNTPREGVSNGVFLKVVPLSNPQKGRALVKPKDNPSTQTEEGI